MQRKHCKKGSLPTERIARLDEIGFVWDLTGSAWEEMFQALLDYKTRFGDCNVTKDWSETPSLGEWCSTQRKAHRNQELSSERLARLEEVGFVWNQYDMEWAEKYEQLVAYKDRFGNTEVPKEWPENVALGGWVSRQRYFRKTNRLSPAKIARLDKLEFLWDTAERDWEQKFQELAAYKQHFGSLDISRPGLYARLSAWCTSQRAAYRKGELSNERIVRLEALGFLWDPINDVWEQRFQELVAYGNRFGSCRVPVGWSENPSLAVWCSHQRQTYKEGKLSPERTTKLADLGFVWDTFQNAWEIKYEMLIDYNRRFGNCNVPQAWNENPKLGRWVGTQRKLFFKGTLPSDRISRLEEIGFRWKRQ